jgi:hypothetical protein
VRLVIGVPLTSAPLSPRTQHHASKQKKIRCLFVNVCTQFGAKLHEGGENKNIITKKLKEKKKVFYSFCSFFLKELLSAPSHRERAVMLLHARMSLSNYSTDTTHERGEKRVSIGLVVLMLRVYTVGGRVVFDGGRGIGEMRALCLCFERNSGFGIFQGITLPECLSHVVNC